MKLQEYINSVDSAVLRKAKAFLQTGNFISLRSRGFYYEGSAVYNKNTVFFEAVIDENNEIQKYSCDCRNNSVVCIHITAMFLGIEKMTEAECSDYHEAVIKPASLEDCE